MQRHLVAYTMVAYTMLRTMLAGKHTINSAAFCTAQCITAVHHEHANNSIAKGL